jgi:hypothetical protein
MAGRGRKTKKSTSAVVSDPSADQTSFVLGPEQWDAFVALLERDARPMPGLVEFISRASILDAPLTAAIRTSEIRDAVDAVAAVDTTVPADRGDRAARIQRAISAVGSADSGTGDVSANHDDIAGDAVW